MLIDLLATMARLDNEKRIERIKQGLERSGYKLSGKKPNETKHKRIKELLAAGNMTKDEIAKAVACGIATVYRVAKSYFNLPDQMKFIRHSVCMNIHPIR